VQSKLLNLFLGAGDLGNIKEEIDTLLDREELPRALKKVRLKWVPTSGPMLSSNQGELTE